MRISGWMILAALSVSIFSFGAKAQEGASGVVKQRKEVMKTIGRSMKGLAAMMQGKAFYEPVKTHALAETIKIYGGAELTKLFPEGSLNEPTKALPVIWSDWQEFKTLSDQLSETANDLVRMTSYERGNNTERYIVDAAFKRLAKTCSACHKTFSGNSCQNKVVASLYN